MQTYRISFSEHLLELMGRAYRAIPSTAESLLEHHHHAWPMFLGGAREGVKIKVQHRYHKEFHTRLYRRLQMHFGKSCRRWSTKEWKKFLMESENSTIMWLELIEASTELDKKLGGVKITRSLFEQIGAQL